MADRRDRFGHVYRRNYGEVVRYLGRRLAADRVEDAAAEVFVVAWRRVGELPTDDWVLPWLYGVARRVLANELRRARRAAGLAEQVAAQPSVHAVADHAGPVADRLAIAEAFDQLGEEDQEVLRLVAWEQLNSAQVAAVLGCARTTAAMRIHRARRRLLARLNVQDTGTAVGAVRLNEKGAN